MIRIGSINLKTEDDDIIINHNIRTNKLARANFTVVGILLDESNNEIISNQLKELNTYYFEGNCGKLDKYLRDYKVKNILIGINLNNLKDEQNVKKYIRYIRKVGKVCRRYKTRIGIIGDEPGDIISTIIFNYRDNWNIKNIKIEDLIESTKVEMYRSKRQRYEYIYDKTCNILDNEFRTKNLCEFKDNKCLEKRKTNVICGCCRHYKNLFSNQLVKCKYLKNKKCSAKCISCKLFTCDTLQKKGIKFKVRDFYFLNYYLNPIQKFIVKYSVFKHKNIIIKDLMRTSLI